MPQFRVSLNDALTAEVQEETTAYNARETARKAALTPPEVHTDLTVEQFIDMRVTEIARSYRQQNSENFGRRIKNAYDNGTPEQKAAVKLALGIS